MTGHDGDMRDARSMPVRALAAVRRFPRSVAARKIGVSLAIVAVSLAGVVLGVLLGGRADTDVGPFRADMSVSPSLHGGTEVVIPPLGSLTLDSHDGPVHLQIRLGALDQGRTQALIDDPAGITRASRTAVEDVRAGLVRLGVRTLAVSVLGALLLSALVFRDVRRTAWSGGLALVIAAASIGVAAGTLRPRSIEEPRYEGLLVNAPAIVGDARRIADDYGRYADQLQRMVANVSRIYGTVSTLPIYEPSEDGARILHVSDLHLNPSVWPMIRSVVEQFQIDAVVDTGDIVDWGSSPETTFVSTIGQLGVPYVYIRGNHDSAVTAAAVAAQRNAVVLDDKVVAVAGLRIGGIGDPRFTPDKETSPTGSGRSRQVIEQVYEVGSRLADTVRESGQPVDICMVHDPESAAALSGVCPTVLAGHTHERAVRMLPEMPGAPPSRLMVEGSTGGAGLRGLEGEEPHPLAMSVLYFDGLHALQAYDDIRVGGAGQAQVTLNRTVVEQPAPPPGTAEGQGQPSPNPAPS
jgi:predicted MPP superfamily phosphohydrolase